MIENMRKCRLFLTLLFSASAMSACSGLIALDLTAVGDEGMCRWAYTDQWDNSGNMYSKKTWISQAENRGLTVEKCASILGLALPATCENDVCLSNTTYWCYRAYTDIHGASPSRMTALDAEAAGFSQERCETLMGITLPATCSRETFNCYSVSAAGAAPDLSESEPNSPQAKRAHRERSGSCFFVSSHGVTITNHHVIEGAAELAVLTPNGDRFKAEVTSQSASTDLAILQTNRQTPDYLSLSAPRSAKTGMEVFTIGYPVSWVLGNEPKFTEGAISSLSGVQGEAAYLQISVPIQPGNSGGPLVNEMGEVVGIVTSSAAIEAFLGVTGTLPQNVNWAVKSDYAELLFDQPPRRLKTSTREEAITRAIKASCRVEVIVN